RRPYQPPPPRPNNNSGWYSWPVIIILFSLGIWPLALVLLFLNLFGDGKKRAAPQSRQAPYGTQSRSAVGQDIDAQARSAVERAMRKAESQVNRAEQQVGRAFDQAGESVDQAVERAMAQMERTIERTARQVEQTKKSASRAAPPPPPKVKAAKPAKEKKQKAKPAGVLLRLLGISCLAIGGIVGLISTTELMQTGLLDFEALGISTGFLFSGGIMFFRGHYLNKMSRRSQRYILAIGNTDAMPLDEIAKRVNRKPHQAAKELQKLIDKGYLGEDAYIDHERGYFLRFGATLEEEKEEDPFELAPEPTPKEAQEGYSGILRNIRHANDRIADPELSRKIDRLEQVSALIFKEVEEHPEKRNSIHTFFDYYLPTTQKLLDTYADFEETGVEGENLREAKERIEQTMDLIVAGFEHQLDQLYSSDAMDVASDIKVMEAMLKRDTASVAKDFGYPGSPKTRPEKGGKPSDKPDDGQMLTMQ
ncbi:MAG: 5-bromo-4-chloroindolyl phosphate hydrolysis family protein, partial [Oscillospiraceae bacterium]|nr:5-bromo-4-chloroindolyl phosphate hydrolysis family protein [Oscillospiraceae bacterium]